MNRSEQYVQGKRAGHKECIAWLHECAKEMNDKNAKAILNAAAFHLDIACKQGWIVLHDKETDNAGE